MAFKAKFLFINEKLLPKNIFKEIFTLNNKFNELLQNTWNGKLK